MTTVDELLSDPIAAAELPDGAIPTHAILLIEYAEPGSDESPGRRRLSLSSDEDLPPWTAIGMMRLGCEFEYNALQDDDE